MQRTHFYVLCCFLSTVLFAQEPIIRGKFDVANALLFRSGAASVYALDGRFDSTLSSRNQQIKAELSLRFLPFDYLPTAQGQNPTLSLQRASMALRLPLGDDFLRITLGKTRLSWGEGLIFNSGDLLYDSSSTENVDLSRETSRDETSWLTSFRLPLAAQSFLEVLAMAPLQENMQTPKSWDESSFGGRFYSVLGELKFEGGYLYRGQTPIGRDFIKAHRAYLGLKSAIVDLNFSVQSSWTVPAEDYLDLKNNLDLLSFSLALYQQLNFDESPWSFNWRLEALTRPWANWDVDKNHDYALLLAPQFTLGTDLLSFVLRGLISPLDWSAQPALGLEFYGYQQLTLYSYLIGWIGEDDDLFPWKATEVNQRRSLLITAGVRYAF